MVRSGCPRWSDLGVRDGPKSAPTTDLQNLLPLYGAEQIESDGRAIIVCEGEPAVDAVLAHKIGACVGTSNGALHTPNMRSLFPLLGHQVILWPDDDDAGRIHMHTIAQRLVEMGHGDVLVLHWKGEKRGADAADFVGNAEALERLLGTANKYDGRGPVLSNAVATFQSPTHLRLPPREALARRLSPTGTERLELQALKASVRQLKERVEKAPLSESERQSLSRLERTMNVMVTEAAQRGFTMPTTKQVSKLKPMKPFEPEDNES